MDTKRDILRDLKYFISYPTVSSDPRHRPDMSACAAWLADYFYGVGMQRAEMWKTATHPVVYAEYLRDSSLPTILFYGHYDVQPADPLDKWDSPPFKAVIRGDYITGRGASDDKGQLFIHIAAIADLLHREKSLPVNAKFLVEGAEEIGSAGLKDCIRRHMAQLQCDVAVVSDTKMHSLHEPALTYSLRGSLNAEITVRTLGKDLHSGTFGGGVANAAIELSELISRLHCKDQSIAIPGFYDDVVVWSPAERAFVQANGVSDDRLLRDALSESGWGEKGYSLHERTTIRPALTVTGITAGHQGAGVKNVIPSVAGAKLNFRLVPNQTPDRVGFLLDAYVRQLGLAAKTTIRYSSPANPLVVPRDNVYIAAAAGAYERVFQRKPKFLPNGGTIAAVDHLHCLLAVPVVLMGFAQAADNMHAPNERFYLPNFFRGIETIKQFIRLVPDRPIISNYAPPHHRLALPCRQR